MLLTEGAFDERGQGDAFVEEIERALDNGIKIINQVIGVAVIIGSIIMLLGTTTNLLRW